jgi:hypothetical protein
MPPWLAFLIIFIVGVVMLGLGIRAIQTGEVVLSARHKAMLRLFGVEQLSRKAAVRIGYGQCIAGGIAILTALTGPFWAGILSGKSQLSELAARPAEPPVFPQLNAPTAPQPNRAQIETPPGPSHSSDPATPVPPERAESHVQDSTPAAHESPGSDRNDPPPPVPREKQYTTLPPLGSPTNSVSPIDYAPDRVARSIEAGAEAGDLFEDRAPVGAVLVGLRVACRDAFGGVIEALQPIYQRGDQYHAGRWIGNVPGNEFEVIAPAGYAVGAVEVRRGGVLNCVRLHYHRIDGLKLDSNDIKYSDWIGVNSGSNQVIHGSGQFLVGIAGRQDEFFQALQVLYLRPELSRPEQPFASLTYNPARAKVSPFLGNKNGEIFVDQAPEGGILVGAILRQGKSWGGALQGIQPVYQVEDRYVKGQSHGTPGGTEVIVLARPGYAVAGLKLRAGLVLNAMQFAFAPLEDGRLNASRGYFSNWYGCDGGGDFEFFAEGHAIAGVGGRFQQDLHGLELLVIDRLRVKETPAPRTWTSADGQFQVRATLVEVTANQEAVLRKPDGTTVTVPLRNLSAADQQYCKER